MKKIIKYLLLIIVCSTIFLCSCERKIKIISLETPQEYYVSNIHNRFGYAFVSKSKIQNLDVIETKTSNNKEIESEFIIEELDGKPWEIKGYYLYAISFMLDCDEFEFYSFTFKADDFRKQTIVLNMNVLFINTSNYDTIVIDNFPFIIGSTTSSLSLKCSILKDITIKDIEVYNSSKFNTSILVNSLDEYSNMSLKTNDYLYLDIELEKTDRLKRNYVYFKIKYLDENNELCEYISEVITFGSTANIFSKIL